MSIDLKRYLPEDPTGIKLWRNERNKFVIVDIHYTADVAKRSPEWQARASAGMPAEEWNREYEKSWETYEGRPVYGQNFRATYHVLTADRSAHATLPMIRGWDFGRTPACVFGQAMGRRLFVLNELCEWDKGADRFIPQVIEFSNLYYPGHSWFDFVDPSGFDPGQTEDSACVDYMKRYGLKPVAGALTYQERLGAVTSLLTSQDNGIHLLQINPCCKMIVEGFKGGYHYPEANRKGVIADMTKPVKNAYSHPHDALQMMASRAFSRAVSQPTRGVVVIPTPKYAFGERYRRGEQGS